MRQTIKKSRLVMIMFLFISYQIDAQEIIQKLTINTGFQYPEANILHALTSELLKRNNIQLEFHVLPNQRALINANNGEDDGDAARIYELNQYYPNLFPSSESIHKIEIVMISKQAFSITDKNNFQRWHVGVIRGMKIAEVKAAQNNPKSLTKGNNAHALLNMLQSARIDIALIDKISFLNALRQEEKKPDTFFMYQPAYIQRKLYFQLHEKFQHLLPQLSQTLRAMKADGSFEKIHDDFYIQFEQTFNQSVKIIPYEKQ